MRIQHLVLLGMVALVVAMLVRMGVLQNPAVATGLTMFGCLLLGTLLFGLVVGVPGFLLLWGLLSLANWDAPQPVNGSQTLTSQPQETP